MCKYERADLQESESGGKSGVGVGGQDERSRCEKSFSKIIFKDLSFCYMEDFKH